MRKYGVMGGTFDPIHIGHLFLAEEIRCHFKLDKIIFVPNGNPPHKEVITPKEKRYDMVKMAIEDNPNFEISDIEMHGEGEIYTIDTMRKFRKQDSETEYFFIFGSDSLYKLNEWKDYRELLGLCKFIAIGRPGFKISDIDLADEYRGRVEILNTIEIGIDSTNVRHRARNSKNIKYLVSPEVEQYIIGKKLYGQEER